MNNYRGVIIEESLADKSVLQKIRILSTKVEQVTDKHKTPWLVRWTLHSVEVPENQAKEIAEEISRALDYSHGSAWYADFKNADHHYIIFQNKVFFIGIFYQNILALGFSLASLGLALFPVILGSLYWNLKQRAVFWSLALGFLSIVVLFVGNQLNPENAVISLPVVLVSLVVFQKLFRSQAVTLPNTLS